MANTLELLLKTRYLRACFIEGKWIFQAFKSFPKFHAAVTSSSGLSSRTDFFERLQGFLFAAAICPDDIQASYNQTWSNLAKSKVSQKQVKYAKIGFIEANFQ